MNDVKKTLQEREEKYGGFKNNSQVSQNIKYVMHKQSIGWICLSADKREALDMIATKISRILSSKKQVKDSWHDIAGYATLIDDTFKEEKKE